MTILDAITSSPFNVLFTIVIGIGLAYLYYRKPSSSSSSSSSSSAASSPFSHSSHHTNQTSPGYFNHHLGTRSSAGAGIIDEELQRTIAQIERQERDMIRQEQDEAYQKSLKADREKRLKREEELRDKEARETAEREQKARLELLHQKLVKLKSEIIHRLPPTPSQGNNEDLVKLVFKLHDGTRVKQDFRATDKVKYLYWFVFSLNDAPLQFKLTTNFPKRDLPGRPPLPEDFEDHPNSQTSSIEPNCEQTLQDVGLTETQIIFVYDLEA